MADESDSVVRDAAAAAALGEVKPVQDGVVMAGLSMTLLGVGMMTYLMLKLLEPTSPAAANSLYKLRLYRQYLVYFLVSRDKSYKPEPVVDAVKEKRRKQIVFVRHGESEWNLVFNKGFGPSFIVRLLRAVARELALLPTRDSIFIDSSLSQEGLQQVSGLQTYLQGSDAPSILTDTSTSVLVSSNLRRSIQTGTLAFRNRIQASGEKVTIMSSLQEISRNVDANALAEAGKVPDLSLIEDRMGAKGFDPSSLYDTTLNLGNKSLKSNGLTRMADFADYCLHRQEASTIVVAGGHSIWFRNFFRAYLPSRVDHIGKNKKIVNCGAVALALVEDDDGAVSIDPDSIQVLYGGFDGQDKVKEG